MIFNIISSIFICIVCVIAFLFIIRQKKIIDAQCQTIDTMIGIFKGIVGGLLYEFREKATAVTESNDNEK